MDIQLRRTILALLIVKPLGSQGLSSRIKKHTWGAIEDELRSMMQAELVIPRDHKFFIRNRPEAIRIVNEDTRFQDPKRLRMA